MRCIAEAARDIGPCGRAVEGHTLHLGKISVLGMPDEPLLPIDDELLTKPSARVDLFDPGIRRLADEMFAIMDREHGAGLAAVQIGRPVRLVVLDTLDEAGRRHRMAMVNPEIRARSAGQVVGEEGCLSMPGYAIPVPRHEQVTVTFQDLDGAAQSLVATGPLSVCV